MRNRTKISCKTLALFLIFVLFPAALPACATFNPAKPALITEVDFSPDAPILTFPIRPRPGSEIYQDPRWGLKIIEIRADGKKIEGVRQLVFFDEMNSGPREAGKTNGGTNGGGLYIYKLRYGKMLFGDLSADVELPFIHYTAPDDVSLLEISYSFVYYNGEMAGERYLLRAWQIFD
ncbi:hypothetical protein [Kiloniella laminariae]|uniref:hypothetical protein n=1 Tax=Kiloniella laminariae TaxID=454162 RepID=UPI000361B1E5|nr:hypothetical protein [Kiloniella laminariae]